MTKEEKILIQARINSEDAKYLKQVLGKEYGLHFYSDIVHKLIEEHQLKDQRLEERLAKIDSQLEELEILIRMEL